MSTLGDSAEAPHKGGRCLSLRMVAVTRKQVTGSPDVRVWSSKLQHQKVPDNCASGDSIRPWQ